MKVHVHFLSYLMTKNTSTVCKYTQSLLQARTYSTSLYWADRVRIRNCHSGKKREQFPLLDVETSAWNNFVLISLKLIGCTQQLSNQSEIWSSLINHLTLELFIFMFRRFLQHTSCLNKNEPSSLLFTNTFLEKFCVTGNRL